MEKQKQEIINLFWSWQSDSLAKENRYFIEDALKRAVKTIGRENAIVINVDRDTKSVGGTPIIAETILGKIRSSDIFIWDATLVYENPKPSPNPNVLFELGYAQAALGDGRTIGIMNVANGLGGDKLPFDLAHRRWPITYNLQCSHEHDSLSSEDLEEFNKQKIEQRDNLTSAIAEAIMSALNEPKISLNSSNVDFVITNKFWKSLNSEWIIDWANFRSQNPQFETEFNFEKLQRYIQLSKLPEYQYRNEEIASIHKDLIDSICQHLIDLAIEMIPDGESGYILSVKREGWDKNYDQKYKRQVEVVVGGIKLILDCWNRYIQSIREIFPEIVANDIA